MADHEHGGNLRELGRLSGRSEKDILDFSANINPLGPPEWFRPLISSRLSSIVHYPDPECSLLKAAIADRYGVRGEEVLAGNGSSEIIYLLPRALPFSRALIPVPTYADYAKAVILTGKPIEKIVLEEEEGFKLDLSVLDSKLIGDEIVFLGQPNNPTGFVLPPEAIRDLATRHPSTFFIVDESFLDFVDEVESLIKDRPPNVIVLRSLTKFYALPGLRLGFAIAEKGLIDEMKKLQPPWSVNALAQAVGEKALKDDAFIGQTRMYVRKEREFLFDELLSLPGVTVYPGRANFLLVRIDRKGMNAHRLFRALLSSGITIRVCANFEGLDERFFRVAVRRREENLKLLDALKKEMGFPSVFVSKRKRTPAVMFQGTGSNAGKSVLAAAMCRILLQDGYRPAPFKAQNMSLNSFVTRDGGEMGRAQVVQAQACRIDPDVRMNPILLKPSSDTGSQVILNGRPVGHMEVSRYIEFKPEAFEAAKKAYDSLAEEFDVIVLEGAGSPAEVNLKHHDIANLRMAEYARAPVILVGDIDRGGVFASFIGTLEVLTEWERRLIAGFVINRFRGQKDLLDPAMKYTQAHTGLPFFGIVPYLQDLKLPEEDSVEFKSGGLDMPPKPEAVEIAVIDLPHISNFTDFDPFRIEPDVFLRIVRSPKDLDHPDVLILPGSKSVVNDLRYLRKSGLEEKIIGLAREGRTEIVGLCGGLQMLGERIEDPLGVESNEKTVPGMGLLPIRTTMAAQKTLLRVEGQHLASGLRIQGYEIHHGETDFRFLTPLVRRDDGEVIGGAIGEGQIWGTYLHGIFDADGFRRWFIDRLRVRRGLPPLGKICAYYDLEPALERLAEVVRRSLRIDEIYRVMGLK
ncbi:MAG: cobyric acid synthase [Desulfobacterota bacterium]|nr:cobyric acid synthase [Thermodesulfobacteriota bacterium]